MQGRENFPLVIGYPAPVQFYLALHQKGESNMTRDLFKPSHTKRKMPWNEALPVFNELSRLIGGGLNGVDHAIGLSSGNFNRYKADKEITLVSYNAMKGVLADIKKPAPVEVCPFDKDDLTELLVLAATNSRTELVVKIAKVLG